MPKSFWLGVHVGGSMTEVAENGRVRERVCGGIEGQLDERAARIDDVLVGGRVIDARQKLRCG